jgi:hypothetical protein
MMTRLPLTRAVLAQALLLSGVIAGGQAAALDAVRETETGEWEGEVINVRWRETRHSAYGPETVVFVENHSAAPVVVVFDWQGRVCDGKAVDLSRAGFGFARELFGGDSLGIQSALKPGEWDSLVFPRALPPEEPDKAGAGCISRIRLQTFPRAGGDTLELTLPAPLPPPAKHG